MTFIDNGVFGFDLSTYQDAHDTPQIIDFQKMKEYGASFVIIRVGQGNYIDQDWQIHKVNSRGILPRAPYWFYDPTREPIAQADLLISAIGNEMFEGRIWLDLEFNWSGAYESTKYWRMFRERVKSRGFLFGIYTRKTWWDDRVPLSEALDFSIDPFWVAQYNDVLNFIPKGVAHPMLWQDGTPPVGHDAGVESIEIDHDKWNSHFDFLVEWGSSPPPPNIPTGVHMVEDKYFKVEPTITSLNIRSSAEVLSNNDLSTFNLTANDIVHVIEVIISGTTTWHNIDKIWRNGNPLVFSVTSSTGQYWTAEKSGTSLWMRETISPVPSPSTLTNTISVFNDGSIKINGIPYP